MLYNYFTVREALLQADLFGACEGLIPARSTSASPARETSLPRRRVTTATKWSSLFGSVFEVAGIGPVLIGPVAVHNTNGRYDVGFDEYTPTPSPEKQK